MSATPPESFTALPTSDFGNPLLAYHEQMWLEIEQLGWTDVLAASVASERQRYIELADAMPLQQRELLGAYLGYVVQPLKRVFSYAVPSEAALRVIKRYSPHGIVEIGAGTGYWARLLSNAGVDIQAFDTAPPLRGSPCEPNCFHTSTLEIAEGAQTFKHAGHSGVFFEILEGNANRLTPATVQGANRSNPEPPWSQQRTLLLCWPPRGPMAYECVQRYRGECLVVVGDRDGKCATALSVGEALGGQGEYAVVSKWECNQTGDERFYQYLHREFECVEELELPHFPFAADWLCVWNRKETQKRKRGEEACGQCCSDETSGSVSRQQQAVRINRREQKQETEAEMRQEQEQEKNEEQGGEAEQEEQSKECGASCHAHLITQYRRAWRGALRTTTNHGERA
jgi:hypothetical protein